MPPHQQKKTFNLHRQRPIKREKEARETKNSRHETRKQDMHQKQLEYAIERKTRISTENGLIALNIASLTPGLMGESTMQKEIVKGLAENRIHIAAIQETHITQDRIYLLGNYKIITAASEKNETSGVVSGRTAIMIHESTQQHITRIRQSSPLLRVTMGHAKSKISNPYNINICTAQWTHTQRKRDIDDGEM